MVYCEKCGKEVEPSLESYNSAQCNSLIEKNPIQNIAAKQDAINRAMESSSHM